MCVWHFSSQLIDYSDKWTKISVDPQRKNLNKEWFFVSFWYISQDEQKISKITFSRYLVTRFLQAGLVKTLIGPKSK